MKPIRTIACLLLALLASPADAANVRFYVGPTGQTLYVRVQTAASTFVAHALTEGTSGGLGNYTCAESTLDDDVTVASTGNGYPFTVRVGSASATADDPVVAYGDLPWSGTAEVSQATLNYSALLAATNGSDTVATQLARLDAAVSSAGGGGTGGPVEHTPVPASRILQVKSRSDGTYGVIGRIYMLPGETNWYAVDLKGTQLAVGDLVDSVSAPTITGAQAANLTAGTYGVLGTLVKFKCVLSGSAATTDTINVKLNITPSSGEVLIITVPVTVGS